MIHLHSKEERLELTLEVGAIPALYIASDSHSKHLIHYDFAHRRVRRDE
jgi:hypothetical protein